MGYVDPSTSNIDITNNLDTHEDYSQQFGAQLTKNPYHQDTQAEVAQDHMNAGIFQGNSQFYDMKSGVASSFKDIMNMRRYDPPIIDVTEAVIKNGSAGKHHEYRIVGHDH